MDSHWISVSLDRIIACFFFEDFIIVAPLPTAMSLKTLMNMLLQLTNLLPMYIEVNKPVVLFGPLSAIGGSSNTRLSN